MRNLRAHAADDLVIFNRHDTALRLFDSFADGREVDVIDKGVVDDRRLSSFFRELFAGFNRFAEQWTGSNQNNIGTLRKNLRFAPLVFGAFHPAQWIILAADEEDVVLRIFA